MRLNEFNCKIDLPKVCEHTGLPAPAGFVKIPRFGWFAYNHDRSCIQAVYDMLEPQADMSLFKYLTKVRPELQEEKFEYTDYDDREFSEDYKLYKLWNGLWLRARKEATTAKLKVNQKNASIIEYGNHLGFPNLTGIGIGLITPELSKTPPFDALPMTKARYYFLIPSFCTPQHICSLERVCISNPVNNKTVWVNEEKGWYGCNGELIVNDLWDVMLQPAVTWSKYLDYWLSGPVKLHDLISVKTCIKIWQDSARLTFDPDPLEIMLQPNNHDLVKLLACDLPRPTAQELERQTKLSILDGWDKAHKKEITLGKTIYIKQDNRYYILEKTGKLTEYANFNFIVKRVYKLNDKFYRVGKLINKEGKAVEVSIANDLFIMPSKLLRELTRLGMENKLGILYALRSKITDLGDIIERFDPFDPNS